MLTLRGIPLRRHLQIRGIALKKAVARPRHRPSFHAYLDRRIRAWDGLVRIHGLESELYPEFSKLNARALAESAGVATPRLIDGPVGVGDLRLTDYGEDFVVKPNWGASGRGVLILHRTAEGTYFDRATGTELDDSGVRRKLEADVAGSGRGRVDELIVEASMAVGDRRPWEWKVFTFYGRVGAIQQNDRSGAVLRIKMYGPDWRDLGRVRSDRPMVSSLPLPSNPQAVVDAALAVSKRVPTGFMRVDLFESREQGVVLGEVCLIPGGDLYFGRHLDFALGEMWDDANVRILAERRPLVP